MMLSFTKMQAFGNDYVYVDAIHQNLSNLNRLAQFLSDHHFGVGSDGMVLICPSEQADFRMRIFNPDGTEAEMCGNAIRSVGKYVYDHHLTDKTFLLIETLGGIKRLWLDVKDGVVVNIKADIDAPVLDTKKIPVVTPAPEYIDRETTVLDKMFFTTAVSWGNPHCVSFVENVNRFDVAKYGPAFENKTALFPNRTNVTFAQFIARDRLRIREWERGTGETIGCGTGCCTAVVAAVLTGRCDRQVTVEQIGGNLEITWEPDPQPDSEEAKAGQKYGHMLMKGPSHLVFESEIDVSSIIK